MPKTIKFKLNISRNVQSRKSAEFETDPPHRFKLWQNLLCKVFCPNLLFKFEFDSKSVYKNAIQDGSVVNTSIKTGIKI